jgi:hypothetical protein
MLDRRDCHLSRIFSLYSLRADTENTVHSRLLTVSTGICSRRTATGCLPRICCPSNGVVTLFCLRGNVFTESLPSNGCLLWLHYSGFRASCHDRLIQWLTLWTLSIVPMFGDRKYLCQLDTTEYALCLWTNWVQFSKSWFKWKNTTVDVKKWIILVKWNFVEKPKHRKF